MRSPSLAPSLLAALIAATAQTDASQAGAIAVLESATIQQAPTTQDGLLDIHRAAAKAEQRRQRHVEERDEHPEDIDSFGEEPALEPEVLLDIRRAIYKLPARQREVVRLLFWEGCTAEEAAALLGVVRKTVQRDLDKALAAMKEALS